MKVFFVYLVTIGLMLGFTGCGGGGSGGDNGNGGDDAKANVSSSDDSSVNAGLSESGQPSNPGPFSLGDFGDITLNQNYKIPSDALFLDIRNEWERQGGGFAKGSVGGAVYEFRVAGDESQDRLRDEFVAEVSSIVKDDKNKLIILICSSGSRTGAKGDHQEDSAANLLSLNGFTNVYHIMGGFNGSTGWKANNLPADRYIPN